MKSRVPILFLILSPFLAACGSSLTVEVMTEGAEGLAPVADLEVQFVPYDRDSLFASLAAAAGTPEPQMPAALQASLDSVQTLQEAWRDAETEWNSVREELRTLSEQLANTDSRSREYREMFDRFNDLEARERALNRERQAAFETYTALQTTTQAQMDSVAAVIQSWEDVAFADFVDLEADLLEALGAQVHFDTTNAEGLATQALGGGDWWVHTRVPVPAGELYWNVLAGAVDTLRLTPDNAEERLVF